MDFSKTKSSEFDHKSLEELQMQGKTMSFGISDEAAGNSFLRNWSYPSKLFFSFLFLLITCNPNSNWESNQYCL
jgi:hypothetical protein